MNKALSAICMFLVLLVSMLSLPALTSASAADDVVFDQIKVNDFDVHTVDGGIVGVTRGDDVEIRVWLSSLVEYNDVSLKASVAEDYKYGDIEDKTRVDLTTGPMPSYLHLELPDDIDTSQDYVLHFYLGGESVGPVITLHIDKEEDKLAIQDVILRPSSSVAAGRPLAVEVRLENVGENKQEDVRVTASIKALGVSTRAYLDELLAEEVVGEEEGETSDSVTLYLPMPLDAVTGEYDLDVDVEYDKGHEVVSTKAKVYVQGTTPEAEVSTIISLDAVSKSVLMGESVTYKLMLANLGDGEAVYSLAVRGAEWADVSLSPGFVRVAPNSAGELTLTLRPKDTATVGEHSLTLRVNQGEKPLRDVVLNTAVSEHKRGMLGLRSVLEIGFAVLVSLLVILGLVVAFKKLGRRDEREPEPIVDNGQSYY